MPLMVSDVGNTFLPLCPKKERERVILTKHLRKCTLKFRIEKRKGEVLRVLCMLSNIWNGCGVGVFLRNSCFPYVHRNVRKRDLEWEEEGKTE